MKKKENIHCSGEGLEGNIRTIRASPPKNYNKDFINKGKKHFKIIT